MKHNPFFYKKKVLFLAVNFPEYVMLTQNIASEVSDASSKVHDQPVAALFHHVWERKEWEEDLDNTCAATSYDFLESADIIQTRFSRNCSSHS